MGAVQVECPECGAATAIGVPIDADIEGVGESADAVPKGGGKRRVVACRRGHEVHVYFER